MCPFLIYLIFSKFSGDNKKRKYSCLLKLTETNNNNINFITTKCCFFFIYSITYFSSYWAEMLISVFILFCRLLPGLIEHFSIFIFITICSAVSVSLFGCSVVRLGKFLCAYLFFFFFFVFSILMLIRLDLAVYFQYINFINSLNRCLVFIHISSLFFFFVVG